MKISVFFSFLLIFSAFFDVFSQKTLSLNSQKVDFVPSFSIENVVDATPRTGNIGRVFVSATQTESISLKGGNAVAIKKLLSQAMPINQTNKVSVSYKILSLKVSEQRLPNGNFSGEMSLRVSFERLGKKDTVSLTETTSATTYLRSDAQMGVEKYQTILIPLFIKSLEYFDKWLTLNGSRHEALVKGIKIILLPETDKNDEDTIYYHTRKITWDDFRGKPTNSRYGAAIFANFAYGATFRVIDGYIVATVQTKTYMVRGMSWVTSGAYSDYALAHEQLHFDIAKLVTERFKKKIVGMKADLVIDLNSMIQYEYLESYREMNRLQNQYDDETNHSLNQPLQGIWERKVKQWLSEK